MTARSGRSAPAGEAGIDRLLRSGLVVTLLVAVSVLIYGTMAVHRERPPIPDRLVAADGAVLYTKDTIVDGKGVFQRTDLMDFGSLYGNGAYFGPDWGHRLPPPRRAADARLLRPGALRLALRQPGGRRARAHRPAGCSGAVRDADAGDGDGSEPLTL